MPFPAPFVVKKGSKSRPRISGAMPVPWSMTSSRAIPGAPGPNRTMIVPGVHDDLGDDVGQALARPGLARPREDRELLHDPDDPAGPLDGVPELVDHAFEPPGLGYAIEWLTSTEAVEDVLGVGTGPGLVPAAAAGHRARHLRGRQHRGVDHPALRPRAHDGDPDGRARAHPGRLALRSVRLRHRGAGHRRDLLDVHPHRSLAPPLAQGRGAARSHLSSRRASSARPEGGSPTATERGR